MFLVAARQVSMPCGRNFLCLCGQSRTRGRRQDQVSGWGGCSVCAWRVAWGLATPGKSLAFVLCYGMRSMGSLGSVFHSQSMCQPLAGMS